MKSINPETNNKSPGNDDLTAAFYKHFSNELTPVLLDAYDSLKLNMFYYTGSNFVLFRSCLWAKDSPFFGC